MPHEFIHSPHKDILFLRLYGEFSAEDVGISDEMGLKEDQYVYLLVDASAVQIRLPPNLLNIFERSSRRHPNVLHVAVYTPSTVLHAALKLFAQFTRNTDLFTAHRNYISALNYLHELIDKNQTATNGTT
jgi:hypothetical protein